MGSALKSAKSTGNSTSHIDTHNVLALRSCAGSSLVSIMIQNYDISYFWRTKPFFPMLAENCTQYYVSFYFIRRETECVS
jgi:hypothetical protein